MGELGRANRHAPGLSQLNFSWDAWHRTPGIERLAYNVERQGELLESRHSVGFKETH